MIKDLTPHDVDRMMEALRQLSRATEVTLPDGKSTTDLENATLFDVFAYVEQLCMNKSFWNAIPARFRDVQTRGIHHKEQIERTMNELLTKASTITVPE